MDDTGDEDLNEDDSNAASDVTDSDKEDDEAFDHMVS